MRLIKSIISNLKPNRIKKNIKKKTIVLMSNNSVWKITFGQSSILLENEFVASKCKNGFIYDEYAVFYECVLKLYGITLAKSSRVIGGKKINKIYIDKLINELISKIDGKYHLKEWYEAFDRERLNKFFNYISSEKKAEILTVLDDVKLPITGAHNDLITRNILITNKGNIRIIDWEYFSETGSVITDILRLYAWHESKIRNHDIDQFSVKDYKEHQIFKRLSEKINLTDEKLYYLCMLHNVCLKSVLVKAEERFRRANLGL